MELRWNPNPHFGGLTGGIGPFLQRRVLSCGAHLYASGISLSISLFGQFHESLGGVTIPSTRENLTIIRDRLNELISALEKDVQLIVLKVVRENDDIYFCKCIEVVRSIYKRWDIVSESEVSPALTELGKRGLIMNSVSFSTVTPPYFQFRYRITDAGISELENNINLLSVLLLTEEEQKNISRS